MNIMELISSAIGTLSLIIGVKCLYLVLFLVVPDFLFFMFNFFTYTLDSKSLSYYFLNDQIPVDRSFLISILNLGPD